jgi:hypothetical protein
MRHWTMYDGNQSLIQHRRESKYQMLQNLGSDSLLKIAEIRLNTMASLVLMYSKRAIDKKGIIRLSSLSLFVLFLMSNLS